MSGERDPVLYLLKDLKTDVRDVKDSVDATNRELGGVQATLDSIRDDNKRQDQQIADIAKTQAACEARTGFKGVNARIKRLENGKVLKDAKGNTDEITGRIDVLEQKQEALVMGPQESWRSTLVKMLPWLLVTFLGGAALIGAIMSRFIIPS